MAMVWHLKLAWGNARRSVRDYSVYFVTLGFSACLMYSFIASTEYLHAMGLTADQLGALGSADKVLRAFSIFTVLVFLFLVCYANRFLLRRRSREFALYELAGMGPASVAVVLIAETGSVGACAFIGGIGLGVLASPAFGALAAFVFNVPWRFAWCLSPDACLWTAMSFAAVFSCNAVDGARTVTRRPLIDLISVARTPERARLGGRVARVAQAVLAAALLAVVWGSCIVQPMYFIALIIPMGCAACLATALIARLAVAGASRCLRAKPGRYWDGLTAFSVRQVEARISSTSLALACVCVLIAAAVCMMVAGFGFSIGLRSSGSMAPGTISALAPIGYVGIFYGSVFLLAAAAVLALQQLSAAADARRAYAVLGQLGCERADMAASLRAQVRLYFAAPVAFALIHDMFGLVLVAFLTDAIGSTGFFPIVVGVLTFTVALMALYGALTVRAAARIVLPGPARSFAR